MTRRRWAFYCICAAAMFPISGAQAAVWGINPVLGIAGGYSTNPALMNGPHEAETNGALLFDAPTTFNGDHFTFFAVPSFRLSTNSGYSSLASDYEHLNLKGMYSTERSTLSADASVARDSSLYHDYLSDGSTGVRRDTVTADLNWDRLLTERTDADIDVNSVLVKYGRSAGVATLTDYRYTSISPTLSRVTGERTKYTVSASVGRYTSLDGTTESRSANLQLGLLRQLTEIWSLTGTIGYSRALNQQDIDKKFLVFTPNGPRIQIVPVQYESSQNGAVYMVDLSRKGSLLTVDVVASRQLVPSGFAYLSRQISFEISANYSYSERWSFGMDAHYLKARDPQLQGGLSERTPKYVSLNASWRCSEFWTATLAATRVVELFKPSNSEPTSNDVSIKFSRKFNPINFH